MIKRPSKQSPETWRIGSIEIAKPKTRDWLILAGVIFLSLWFLGGMILSNNLSSSSETTPNKSTQSLGASTPSPKQVSYAGFGALDTDWDEVHGNDASYFKVQHLERHVTGYNRRLAKGTSFTATREQLLKDLPSDTKVIWEKAQDTCVLLEVQSATIGTLLANPKIGDSAGMASLEIYTDTQGNGGYKNGDYEPYDSNNANGGQIDIANFPTAADAPPC